MDELSAGGMAPQIRLAAPGDACFAQQRKDPAGDGQRPALAGSNISAVVEHVTVVVGDRIRPGLLWEGDRDDQ
jgi:hypothetical protein